jgi:alpha-glucosidase
MISEELINRANDWWKRAVFYQIYPRSFMDSNDDGIGDLPGIISRLDYLNDGTPDSLGIDAIWFSPFFTSPDYDYGYDVADYCDIDPRYGTLDDFDRLLAEAHRRNIMVMLDLVVNHTSHLHSWFLESRSSRDNPKRDWYIWKNGRGPGKKLPNNWRNNFFGPAWTWDEKTGQYYLHSFLKEQPDLNWQNPAVREAIGNVIRFWLDRGVDGFRLDVAHIYCKDEQFRNNPPFFARKRFKDGPLLSDRTLMANIMKLFALPELQVRKYNQHQPETHEVLRQFRQIYNEYPAVTSVGEIISDDPGVIASYYGKNNDELHMNFYFELLNCRWKAGAFRRCIDRWEHILPVGTWPAYTFSNHDVVRAISRYGGGEKSDQKARLLTMILLSLRGTPFIYYGEEIAMKEAVLPKDCLRDPIGVKWYPLHRGRDGCRTPMQWNNSHYAGFSSVEPWLPVGPDIEKRNVSAQINDSNSQLNFLKKMIWLRKTLPALLEGDYRSLTDGVPDSCYCYLRETDQQKLAVCLNFSSRRVEINPIKANGNSIVLISTNHSRNQGNIVFPFYLEADEGCLIEYSAVD